MPPAAPRDDAREPPPTRWWQPARLTARWHAWWLHRHPARDELVLTQRNVYILPTAPGWLCALLLLVLLLGSINYQLNLGYLLTFMLASAAAASMHSAHAALRGLQWRLLPPQPLHAEGVAQLQIELRRPDTRARHGIGLCAMLPEAPHHSAAGWIWLDLPAAPATGTLRLSLPLQTLQPGRHALPALQIATRYPFGLFRAWSIWRPAAQISVWPAPEFDPPPVPGVPRDADTSTAPGTTLPQAGIEPDGVRAYRRGDSPTQIAWRKSASALASGGELVSHDRQPQPAGRVLSLRWQDTAALGTLRARQERIAGWLLDAERSGLPYAVELPSLQLPPGRGETQRLTTLQALTDLGPPATNAFDHATPPAAPAPSSGLPREARDTLFLLGALGWTLLPQLARVPMWCSALTLLALSWRIWLAWRSAALPSRWVLALVLALAAALTWRDHGSLIGKEAGVTLLVLLAALKTLELRARRDHWVVFGLGFFLILANFLYSQSLATALMMLGALLALLTALVLAHLPAGRPPLWQAAGLASRQALLGAPLVLVLFVFFPRIGPLWNMPGETLARTGLSDRLRLGDVAELAQDDSVALRVRFDGPMPPHDQLYFRGPVLVYHDGRQWLADQTPRELPQQNADLPPGTSSQDSIGYELTLEPLRVQTLPLPEYTLTRPSLEGALIVLRQRTDLQWFSHLPVTERVRLRGRAWYRLPPPDAKPALTLERLLPQGVHPRTQRWARDLQDRLPGASADQLAAALLQHIRTGGYSYTLVPGPPSAADPLDDFWLDRKRGFCEHYAAAFVVLMRTLGVPARIVTGYQGGLPNPIDGVLEVRQADAHAWAEYWRDGHGWTRIDPTGAVAPERIERGQRLRRPNGLVADTLGTIDPALAGRLQALWSSLDHRWNQWVIQHGQQRQMDLLKRLGWLDADPISLGRAVLIGLALIGLLGAGWALGAQRFGRARVHPWLRAWGTLQQRLRRHGLAVEPHEPPGPVAERALRHWGEPARPLAELLRRFERLRYAPRRSGHPPTARQLAREANRLLRRLPASERR